MLDASGHLQLLLDALALTHLLRELLQERTSEPVVFTVYVG